MFRSLALALLISLAGAPLADIVCSLSCAEASSAAAMAGHHHDHGSGQGGNRFAAVHLCASVTADPFVLNSFTTDNAQKSLPISQATAVTMLTRAPISGVWIGQVDIGTLLPPPQRAVLRI